MSIEPVMLSNHLSLSQDNSSYLNQGHFTEMNGSYRWERVSVISFSLVIHSKGQGPFKIRTFTYKLHLENGWRTGEKTENLGV